MTVLRHPPLGDVKLRHDLDPRHRAVQEVGRDPEHVPERPVHSEPDRHGVRTGLDVDVTCPLIQRPVQHLTDQPHRGARDSLSGQLRLLALGARQRQRRLVHHRLQRVGAAGIQTKLLENGGPRRRGRPHTATQDPPDHVHELDAQRIGHGQEVHAVVSLEGDHLALPAEAQPEGLKCGGIGVK